MPALPPVSLSVCQPVSSTVRLVCPGHVFSCPSLRGLRFGFVRPPPWSRGYYCSKFPLLFRNGIPFPSSKVHALMIVANSSISVCTRPGSRFFAGVPIFIYPIGKERALTNYELRWRKTSLRLRDSSSVRLIEELRRISFWNFVPFL